MLVVISADGSQACRAADEIENELTGACGDHSDEALIAAPSATPRLEPDVDQDTVAGGIARFPLRVGIR